MGYFKETNAFPVCTTCYETVHAKWCLHKSVWQTENGLERVKHSLNCFWVTSPRSFACFCKQIVCENHGLDAADISFLTKENVSLVSIKQFWQFCLFKCPAGDVAFDVDGVYDYYNNALENREGKWTFLCICSLYISSKLNLNSWRSSIRYHKLIITLFVITDLI